MSDPVNPPQPPGYPAEWEFDALARDGTPLHVRPIRPDDAPRLAAMHARLSLETIYRRFFAGLRMLSERTLEHFTQLDYVDRLALVATLGDRLIAVARYERAPASPLEAEVAFVVDDEHQGRGIGTLLLEHLAAAARERGIERFVADTQADNRPMLSVFRDAGFAVTRASAEGLVHVAFPIAETPASLAAMEQRERRAQVESIAAVLRPKSIAVVGASRQPQTIGHELFRNLLEARFQGPLYPVNPAAEQILGVPAYGSMAAIPGPVDLAVVTVPQPRVAAVVDECGAKGVKALVVISAGFAEVGTDGAAAERDVIERARRHGMRVVGPNCMGVLNMSPGVSMNATFAPVRPERGRVAFLSQSGALGIAVLQQAAGLGLGVSSFVSVGNKADVSGNDLLQYWEADPETDVVLLYLESFGNPRRFARIARRVSEVKPIIAVKSGRTASGARAAQSHTASAATPDTAIEALFRQAGVVRVDTLEELFDTTLVLAHQPHAPGRRIAIVGNSGGPGILAADACETAGLQLATLAEATVAGLRAFASAGAALGNPVDLIASADASQYERAVRALLDDPGVDMVLVIFTPPLVTRTEDIAAAVHRALAAAPRAKPVAVNMLTGSPAGVLMVDGAATTIPRFPFPERAVRALARAAGYAAWRRRASGTVPPRALDLPRAREVVRVALDAAPGGGWLDAASAAGLLAAAGIPVLATRVAHSRDAAVAAAKALGFPVALKAQGQALVHKSDRGGVRLGLPHAAAVGDAFDAMRAALGSDMEAAIVQPMAAPGIETIVGLVHDRHFGPLVMFGLGGVLTDLLGDRAFRILPLTDVDAAELVHSVKSSPLLFGYRGAPPSDVPALTEVLLRLAQLADQVPELQEVDLNPVVVRPQGAEVLDAKVRVGPAVRGPGPLMRRLR